MFYFKFNCLSSRYIFQVKSSLQSNKMIVFYFDIFSIEEKNISDGMTTTIEKKRKRITTKLSMYTLSMVVMYSTMNETCTA